MIIIGENINATNKKVAEAIDQRNEAFFTDLAQAQAKAGANFIDVNSGSGHGSKEDGIAAMEWLVGTVQAATEKPLAIDSDNPGIIEAALQKYTGGGVVINSVTADEVKLDAIGSVAAEHKAWLVALAMGGDGIPDNVEQRLAACETIVTHLTRLGVSVEQIFFDPLVLPIAVDSSQGLVTLKTIEEIKSRYPDARTVAGLSNISYGLPNRKLVNRAFLLMAIHAGLDAVILDPLDTKMMSMVKVADMLTGKDVSCRTYIRAHRRGTIAD